MFNLFKSKPAITPNLPMVIPQPTDEPVIELTEDMMVKPIEKPAEQKLVIIKTSWDYKHCAAIGCNKALEGCCLAYRNPAILPWFRQGKECPTGPYTPSMTTQQKKINPIKASKRKTR